MLILVEGCVISWCQVFLLTQVFWGWLSVPQWKPTLEIAAFLRSFDGVSPVRLPQVSLVDQAPLWLANAACGYLFGGLIGMIRQILQTEPNRTNGLGEECKPDDWEPGPNWEPCG